MKETHRPRLAVCPLFKVLILTRPVVWLADVDPGSDNPTSRLTLDSKGVKSRLAGADLMPVPTLRLAWSWGELFDFEGDASGDRSIGEGQDVGGRTGVG